MNLKFWQRKKGVALSSDWFVRDVLGSGLNIPEEAVEKVEYVYDCVRTRAQKIASIPWGIWKGKDRVEKLEQQFKNPNPYQTSTQFIESIVSWLDLRGIAFVYLNYPYFEILDSDLVWLHTENGKISYRYAGKDFNDEQVKIIKNFTPYSRLYPVSTLASAFGSVKIMEDYETVIEKLMEKGAYIPAVLLTQQTFTQAQVEQVQKLWRESYSGISNAGKLLVLSGGLDIKKIGLTPAELDILSRDTITKDRIYTAFGVPKKDFQNLNRATAEVQQEFFIRTTIMPFADGIAEQISKFLLNGEAEFKFDYGSLPEMQGDLLTKAQVEEIHIRSGVRTINEIRSGYGLNSVPWGNDYWANMSLVSFGNYTEQTETLRSLKNEISEIKKSLKTKEKITAEQKKELRWKIFIARTTPEENKLEKEIDKFFKKLGQEVAEKLEGKKTILKFNIEDLINLDLVPKEKVAQFIKLLTPYILSFMQQAGDAVIEEYGLAISFNLQTPEIQKWIKWKLENSASVIIKTTQKDLYDVLIDGINAGEGIPDLAKRVNTLFEETYKHRAETIARTEVISANNKASLEGMRQCGIKTKTWLAALDERTREAHAAADGQTVNIDEPFKVGGEELDFPGDPKGSPENIINCRCTIIWNGEE